MIEKVQNKIKAIQELFGDKEVTLPVTFKIVNGNVTADIGQFTVNDVVVTNTFYKGEALNMVISDETGMYMTIERWHAPAGWAGILNHRIDVLVSASFLYFTGNTNVSWRIEAIRDVTMELS